MNNLNILKDGANMSNKNIKKECEELWAKNKYYVLSKSHKVYLEIRKYLQEKEIRQLERTVTAYFDYIEGLVERRNTFTMRGLADSIDRFLSFNEYEILEGKGSISKKQADSKAIQEYEKFNRTQKILSDFDKHILKIMRES